MKIEQLHKLFKESAGVCTDTRQIKPRCLFFSLKGGNFNGNQFAEKAISLGAGYAIIDEKEYSSTPNTILVNDVLKTLQDLASYHRMKFNIPFIAVTGSNGKTTSKELLNAVLSKKYNVAYTKGNLNNHIGVPLTLLDVNETDQIALVEMGDNHPKEVALLCEIAKPDFGFVTNVGKDHLEGFGSFEKNILAKKEVFDYLQKTNGTVFVDQSDLLVSGMVDSSIRTVTYGMTNSFSYIEFKGADPTVQFVSENKEEVKTQLFGGFNFNNMKLAYCIGKYFEISDDEISNALANYTPDNNRSQVIETSKNTLIMDAYNANPSSVLEAVNSLAEMQTDKLKVVILGDMFELGSYAKEEHQLITNRVAEASFSSAILVGENYFNSVIPSKVNAFKTKKEAEIEIKKIAPEGAIILLKGSRGMRMETFKDIL